jgi:hypothetical protein
MRAGSIKAYAVTSETRLALAPDIPTFAEMGLPALSYSAWFGLFAPRGTPTDIIGKLNADPLCRCLRPGNLLSRVSIDAKHLVGLCLRRSAKVWIDVFPDHVAFGGNLEEPAE